MDLSVGEAKPRRRFDLRLHHRDSPAAKRTGSGSAAESGLELARVARVTTLVELTCRDGS